MSAASKLMVKETTEIDWDRALDALNFVCPLLGITDLYKLTHVNWACTIAAKKQIDKLDYIQLLLLDYILKHVPKPRSAPLPQLESKNDGFNRKLSTSPALTILVCDEKWKEFEDQALRDVRRMIPEGKTMMIRATKFLTSDNVDSVNEKGLETLAGLFFPTDENGTRIRMAWTQPSYDNAREEADRVIDLLEVAPIPATYLIFSKHSERVRGSASYHLTQFLSQGMKYGLAVYWPAFGDNIGVMECNSKDTLEHPNLVVLKLSGIRIRTWNTQINLNWPRGKILLSLYDLRRGLLRKRKCVGLVYAEVYGNEMWKLIMLDLKDVFPNIPFTAIYGDKGRKPLPEGDLANQSAGDIDDELYTPLMAILILSLN